MTFSIDHNFDFKLKWRKIENDQCENNNNKTPKARHGHRAITIKNMMFIFGGGNDYIFDEFYLYIPQINEWILPKMTGDIPSGVAAFGMTDNQTHVYLFGGLLKNGKYSSSLYELDLSIWDWKKLNPSIDKNQQPPCARLGHSFVMQTSEQRIILFGGMFCDKNEWSDLKYLNDLYILDIGDTNNYKWSIPATKGQSPSPRESHSAIIHKNSTNGHDQMFIYGGMCNERLGDLWILDLETMCWNSPTISGIAPLPRSLHSANVFSNKMYIFGGTISKDQNNSECTDELAIMNMDKMEWIKCDIDEDGFKPKPRSGHSSVIIDSRIYFWSGHDARKKIYYSDLCYIDLESPKTPKNLQLVQSKLDALLLRVDPDILTEFYLVQLKKVSPVLPKTQSLPPVTSAKPTPNPPATTTSTSTGKQIIVRICDKKSGKLTSTPVESFPEIKEVLERNNGKISPQQLLAMVKNHLAAKNLNKTSTTTTYTAAAASSTSLPSDPNPATTTATVSQSISNNDASKKNDPPNNDDTSSNQLLATEDTWYDAGIFRKPSFFIKSYLMPKKLTTNPSEDKIQKQEFQSIKLESSTRYKIRVASINGQGISDWCEGPEIGYYQTCSSHLPSSPFSIKIKRIDEGIRVDWKNISNNSNESSIDHAVYLAVDKDKLSANNPQSDNNQPFLKVYDGSQNHCIVRKEILRMAHIEEHPKPALILRIASHNNYSHSQSTEIRWLFDEIELENRLKI